MPTPKPVCGPLFTPLRGNPDAQIYYSFFPGESAARSDPNSHSHLVVFINGLGLPASSWLPGISLLRDKLSQRTLAPYYPAILTYDRFGQGLTTARDPLDSREGVEEGYGHDFMDVVRDLHELITKTATSWLGLKEQDVEDKKLQLFLVGASIGGPLARLYTQHHPGIVAGMLLLDSNICNVNYSEILPDPDAPGFAPEDVVRDDCTLEQYKEARSKLVAMFDLNIKNAEHLDRRTGLKLLPLSSGPQLEGPASKGPLLSIVGHDPVTFADEGFERMGTPRSMTMKFLNRYWADYNSCLTRISENVHDLDVVIAKGCGHFIQLDDPSFVAEKMESMLAKLGW